MIGGETMIKRNQRTLPITFEVNKEYQMEDDRFISVTIDVLHTGENLNGSYFSKEVVEQNLHTLANMPIVGFIQSGFEKDFKGHEYILTRTDKGGIARTYKGSAYGIVPESCNPRWITKECDDGVEREFLQVDGLVWTKFSDSVDILTRDEEKAHSMELSENDVEGYEDEDGIFHFTKFSFTGFCVLGEGVNPAMVNSDIQVNFTVSDFIDNVQKEIIDKYTTFSKMLENGKVGGKGMDFSQTVMEMFSDISNIVRQQENIIDRWGDSYARYSLCDIQDNEVIIVDRKNNYQHYGCSFTINGDKPEIDFSSCKRKKTRYEDYVDGEPINEGAFDFGKHIVELEEIAYSKVEEANAKLETVEKEKAEAETNYTTAQTDLETVTTEFETVKGELEETKAKLEDIEPKYNEYVQAEQQRELEEINASKDAMIANFEESLADVVEFSQLKEDKDNLSVEEIESKCAIMFYKKQAGTNFSKANGRDEAIKIYPDNEDNTNYVSTTKYGNIRINK